MLRGWFDAFRQNGGPTLYGFSNRTPVIEDIRNILIYVSFATLFLAFLIIFPGIRKERVSTFICVTTSLFVGAVVLLTNYGTDWHVSSGFISSPYKAFSKERLFADIGVRIGLNSVNVTLQATPVHNQSEDINYNERFTWLGATQMKKEYRSALVKGLPFPILTVAEYLSQDVEGFAWGRRYRLAGYYCNILLWTSFAFWLLMNILLCTVPRYGAYSMVLTGGLMLVTDGLYALLLPRRPLCIHMETIRLTFKYGWCFWTVLTAGFLAVIVGVCVAVLDNMYPNKFSTIFEVDYDTPYRYFVGQDNTPRGPLHPQLSDTSKTDLQPEATPGTSGGIDNAAFEEDLEDYGTIINGKRAVSLHHFGKFAQKEAAARKGRISGMQRRLASSSFTPGSRKQDVNIDMQAAAMW